MQIYVSRHANKQHHFCVNSLGTFSGRRGPRSSVAQDWGCGGGVGVKEGFQRGKGGQRGSQPFRLGPAGRGGFGGTPELERLRLVLSDVPLLQNDLSLPGRQLALVVAQRPQLLRLLFLPLHLLLLLSLLLFPRHGVGAEPRARVRGWARPHAGSAVARSGLLRAGVAEDRGTRFIGCRGRRGLGTGIGLGGMWVGLLGTEGLD